jgi:hypothetical protein
MKNVVFWDIKTQFVPHMRHIMSPLQSLAILRIIHEVGRAPKGLYGFRCRTELTLLWDNRNGRIYGIASDTGANREDGVP